MESDNRAETQMMETNRSNPTIDGQMMEHFLATNQGMEIPATTKVDAQQLAQNRCNAMLRYKEKKKTRRYTLHDKTQNTEQVVLRLTYIGLD